MTRSYVNPFERMEGRHMANPPLKCAHPVDPCGCYVPIDDLEREFETFQLHFADTGGLQNIGFFVCVCGSSGCGKTSLINRCAAAAGRELKSLGITSVEIDLAHHILGTGAVPIEQRTRKVGERLIDTLILRHPGLFIGGRIPDREALKSRHLPPDGSRTDLDSVIADLAQALKENTAVIVILPPTDQPDQLRRYWASMSERFLFFAESTYRGAADLMRDELVSNPVMRSACLKAGFLRRGDAARFGLARIDIHGRGVRFPDLDTDALENYIGNQDTMQIGFMQTLLYRIYAHYENTPWPPGNIIRGDDIGGFMEGPEG